MRVLFPIHLTIVLIMLGFSCSDTDFSGGIPDPSKSNSSSDSDDGGKVDTDGDGSLTVGSPEDAYVYDGNGDLVIGTGEVELDEDGDVLLGDDFEIPGATANLVGVGYAAGNHDDWNDGAVCFEATDREISVENKKIRVNKNVTLKLKLFADMLPEPTLVVTRIKVDGTEVEVVSKRLSRGGRHEVTAEFKKGDSIFTELKLDSGGYNQNSTEWSRITLDNCDDYADR